MHWEAAVYNQDAHAGFVRTSWVRGARERWDALAHRLRRPETRCLVAHVAGQPDSLLGWVAVDTAAGAVIWCYTRDLYGKVRRRGLMTSLLLLAGVDVSEPTPCLYWSPAAADIAARGYRIYYAPRVAHEREAA